MSELDRLGEELRQAVAAAEVAATRRCELEEALSLAHGTEARAWKRASEARAAVLEACGVRRPDGTYGMRMEHAH